MDDHDPVSRKLMGNSEGKMDTIVSLYDDTQESYD